MIIATKRFTLPVGYQYQISNPMLWYTSAAISGTVYVNRNVTYFTA